MKTSDKAKVEVQIIEMTPKDAGKVPLCGHKKRTLWKLNDLCVQFPKC